MSGSICRASAWCLSNAIPLSSIFCSLSLASSNHWLTVADACPMCSSSFSFQEQKLELLELEWLPVEMLERIIVFSSEVEDGHMYRSLGNLCLATCRVVDGIWPSPCPVDCKSK